MYRDKKIAVLIAAAGSGTRMGDGIPKQYLKIGGKPLLLKTVQAFCRNPAIDAVFVVTHKAGIRPCLEMKEAYGLDKIVSVTEGGAERQDSVYAGLREVNRQESAADYVLVHDGARPFVSQETIEAVIAAAVETGAAVACVPVTDTIRQADGAGGRSLDRGALYAVQTPQGFQTSILTEAYEKAFAEGFYGTDDAGLVERLGQAVALAPGEYGNIKITTREDLPAETRIGTGYDAHRLTEGRKLVLGGVEIPFEQGLLGHSDADVLIHALIDALLGSAALGDIGTHFPDTEGAYQNISSIELLQQVKTLLDQEYYQIGNLDLTLMAERPKIKPFISQMRQTIARALEIDESCVSIKGTTTERMGFTGREEGMAAQAVCLIRR